MTGSAEMAEVLARFAEQFNRMPEMPRMTQGWDRWVVVRARDAGWTHALRVEGGRMTVGPGPVAGADITLDGPADTLASIFRGELSPTEPYLDGSIAVHSTEEDMLKLDVFTLMVWGE